MTGPFGNEPALDTTSGPQKASRTGIPATGRRRYSRWESGPSLDILDGVDVSHAASMAVSHIDDTDILESIPDCVQEAGEVHDTLELSHIMVAGSREHTVDLE